VCAWLVLAGQWILCGVKVGADGAGVFVCWGSYLLFWLDFVEAEPGQAGEVIEVVETHIFSPYLNAP
jgi:hypothetical protein